MLAIELFLSTVEKIQEHADNLFCLSHY